MNSELTRLDIIKCIQSEKVRFRGVNLSGLDLSKLDLSYVDFSFACLKGVFFSRANLQCAKFRAYKGFMADLFCGEPYSTISELLHQEKIESAAGISGSNS